MNIRNLIMSIGVLIFISGCAKKESVFITENKIYSVALQHTKKSDIVKSLQTKLIFIGTYLNYVDKSYDDENHNFLVSVYIPDQNSTQKSDDYVIFYGCETVELLPLEETEMIYNNIPLKNHWAKYYRIKIPKDNQEFIKLDLETSDLNYAILWFQVKN
ncbi:MAG: hypothetical protein M0P43_02380 [Arcobacteraceae bacterium]|nr:hypothetical protein [Arcobacteraceae bacterium]MDY0328490.1 hypothetical protein [Arcobacteraceae bacterium]